MTPHGHRRRSLRRWGSLACLLTYLAGAAEFLPELLGFLCSLDPSHTVYVIREPSEIRVVLSHERGRATGASYQAEQDPASGRHHHGFAARLLCSFTRSSETEADHEALFGASAVSEASEGDSFKLKRIPASAFDLILPGSILQVEAVPLVSTPPPPPAAGL